MGGAFDAVGFRDGEGSADERVEQRKFVANRGEAVVFDEFQRDATGEIRTIVKENAIPRDEDVVEDGERFPPFCVRWKWAA